ncbi:MAG TPA: hypothetical protein VFL04_03150 [Rectinemataceae bacterium]|nr:hypothetical protein [Rectinemataceae bacterium]
MNPVGALGKKVFFLYPPPVLAEIMEGLAKREFEVYTARSHKKLLKVLAQEPESIVFINIDDESLDDGEWQDYVRGLREGETTAGVGVGILTLNEPSPELRERYLMDIQVPCGFVVLKIGATKTTEILVKTLEANEARGRRKFVRAICSPGSGHFAATHEGKSLNGSVSDLSSAGFAVGFEDKTQLKVGTVVRGVLLTVKGVRIGADAFVAAMRTNGESTTHVLMFVPGANDEHRLEKLRSLVFRINQTAMDSLMAGA